jgi:hypothetical protein
LIRVVDPAEIAAALDAVLPPGLDVIDAVVAGPGSLADRMEASLWEFALPGADPVQVEAALAAFLAAESVPVARRTKGGMRDVDTRAASVKLEIQEPSRDGCVILRGVVRHTTPVVRPDDILAGLRAVAPLELVSPLVATRLAQGLLCTTERPEGDAEEIAVEDPLTPDRVFGGTEPGFSA